MGSSSRCVPIGTHNMQGPLVPRMGTSDTPISGSSPTPTRTGHGRSLGNLCFQKPGHSSPPLLHRSVGRRKCPRQLRPGMLRRRFLHRGDRDRPPRERAPLRHPLLATIDPAIPHGSLVSREGTPLEGTPPTAGETTQLNQPRSLSGPGGPDQASVSSLDPAPPSAVYSSNV